MIVPKIFLALAGALLVTACSETGVTVHEQIVHQGFLSRDFDYAAHTGEIRVAVIGSPITDPAADFAENTAVAMRGANRGDYVRFTTRPEMPDPENYHVVMIFNRGLNLADYQICGNTAASIAPLEGPRTSLVVGFCIGPDPLLTAEGTGPAMTGADDPQLRTLIRETVHALIPNEDRARSWR